MTDTDWVNRFGKGLDENAVAFDKERIMEGRSSFDPERDPAGTAHWVAGAVERMEERLDRPSCERVMFACAHRYPDMKMLEYRTLYERTKDVDVVLRKICRTPRLRDCTSSRDRRGGATRYCSPRSRATPPDTGKRQRMRRGGSVTAIATWSAS